MKRYYLIKNFKHILIAIIVINFLAFTAFNVVLAEGEDPYGLKQSADKGTLPTTQTDPTIIAGKIINYVLGIVGTIFLVVILVGGYKWMTAAGHEEKIVEAKKMIIQGMNGMIVIFLAYALAYAIIQGLYGATNETTPTTLPQNIEEDGLAGD